MGTPDKLGIPWWIYVGTQGEGSKGIYLFLMKTSENPDIPEVVTMTPLGLVAETASPTYLVVDAKHRRLCCVNAVDPGTVSAYAIEASGKLALLGTRPSLGVRPSHLALDGDGAHVVVANDVGVAVLPIGSDGKLGEGTVQRHPVGAHVRGVIVSPDGRFVLACDAGLDRVIVHRFDGGKLSSHGSVPLKPGAGPRHLVFHPGGAFAYVVNELDSTVTALSYDARAGVLKPLQTLSTLPGYFDGANKAAELAVHPGGKYLYASNCGHNSVVLFGIDPGKGTLTYIEDQSTYGTMPVHFGLDTPGKHLAVANRQSGSILILRAPESGRVKPGGKVTKLAGATCAVFVAPFQS